jgi:magnesium transporter
MKTTLKFWQVKRIHYATPTPQEINDLIEEYEYHELIAEDLQDVNVQHKIDQYDDVIFMVLNFPKYNTINKRYILNEFNIILGKDSIITLSRYEASHIAKIIEQYKMDIGESDIQDEEAYKISPYYILYTIIDAMYDKTIKAQSNASKDLVLLESSMSDKDITRGTIEDLMRKKANVAFLKYTYLPQKEILVEMQKVFGWFYEWDLDVYFEDLESKLDKIINSAMILYETIQSLVDTYDAMLNLQTNTVIRTLTVFTALTWILTFISWFYGMNIQLPLMNNPYARVFVMILMLAIIFMTIQYFKKKRWI